MEWRNLLALLVVIESEETLIQCSKALLDGFSYAELPDLCHEIIVGHLLHAQSLYRRNASILLAQICEVYSGYLIEILAGSTSDGEIGTFMQLDIDHILNKTLDKFLPQDDKKQVIATKTKQKSNNEHNSNETDCRHELNTEMYKKNWLKKQRNAIMKELSSSSQSEDFRTALQYTNLDFEYEEKIPMECGGFQGTEEVEGNDLTEETWLARLVRFMITKMLSKRWEEREGAVMGLNSILMKLQPSCQSFDSLHSLPLFLIEDIACLGFTSIIQDQIMDLGLHSENNQSSILCTTKVFPLPIKEILGRLVVQAIARLKQENSSQKLLQTSADLIRSDRHWLMVCTGLILAYDSIYTSSPMDPRYAEVLLESVICVLGRANEYPWEVYFYTERLIRTIIMSFMGSKCCLGQLPVFNTLLQVLSADFSSSYTENPMVVSKFVSIHCLVLKVAMDQQDTLNTYANALASKLSRLISGCKLSQLESHMRPWLGDVGKDFIALLESILHKSSMFPQNIREGLLVHSLVEKNIIFNVYTLFNTEEINNSKEAYANCQERVHHGNQYEKIGLLLADILILGGNDNMASILKILVENLFNLTYSVESTNNPQFSLTLTSFLHHLIHKGVLTGKVVIDLVRILEETYSSSSYAVSSVPVAKKRRITIILNDKPMALPSSADTKQLKAYQLQHIAKLGVIFSLGFKEVQPVLDVTARLLSSCLASLPSVKPLLIQIILNSKTVEDVVCTLSLFMRSILEIGEEQFEYCLTILMTVAKFKSSVLDPDQIVRLFDQIGVIKDIRAVHRLNHLMTVVSYELFQNTYLVSLLQNNKDMSSTLALCFTYHCAQFGNQKTDHKADILTISPQIDMALLLKLISKCYSELKGGQYVIVQQLVSRTLYSLTQSDAQSLTYFARSLYEMIYNGAAEMSQQIKYHLGLLFSYLVQELKDEIALHAYPMWLYFALHGISDDLKEYRSAVLASFNQLVSYAPIAMKYNPLHTMGLKNAPCNLVQVLGKSSTASVSLKESENELDLFLVQCLEELCITKLRNYQWHGISWFTTMRRLGLSGILADEMGLGKTLQALSCMLLVYLEKLYFSGVVEISSMLQTINESSMDVLSGIKVLVIAPAALVRQWAAEIVIHFANLSLLQCIVCDDQNSDWTRLIRNSTPVRIFIVSFDNFRRHAGDFQSTVWEMVVIDEAHTFRNPATQIAKAVFALHSKCRLALTGTPLQNQVEDIWSLMNFIVPDYLGDHSSFRKRYEIPIKNSLKNLPAFSLQMKQANKRLQRKVLLTSEGIALLKSLHKQVLPFILRRTKDVVLKDLPRKTILDLQCPLTSIQKSMYDDIVQKCLIKEDDVPAAQLSENCSIEEVGDKTLEDETDFYDALSKMQRRRLINVGTSSANQALMAVRCLGLISIHPGLVIGLQHSSYRQSLIQDLGSSGKFMELIKLLWELHITTDEEMIAGFGSMSWYAELEEKMEKSCKRASAQRDESDGTSEGEEDEEDGESFENNAAQTSRKSVSKKCLIFAQHRSTLDLVETAIFRNHLPTVKYARLDGSIPPTRRFDIVQQFNRSSECISIDIMDSKDNIVHKLKSLLPSCARTTVVEPESNIRVLLLTTRASGLGLNLTAADTVIFLEHDWNPFADLQAMDRVHRLGQVNPVTVYRLIADSTIESRLLGLQNFKQYISSEVLPVEDQSMTKNTELGNELLESLLSKK